MLLAAFPLELHFLLVSASFLLAIAFALTFEGSLASFFLAEPRLRARDRFLADAFLFAPAFLLTEPCALPLQLALAFDLAEQRALSLLLAQPRALGGLAVVGTLLFG
ncbi:MAG: hypothetical protein O3A76_14085 [Chloroflexi bacterium]|nr:hypothetical protein [Chloroflexota bacterium]